MLILSIESQLKIDAHSNNPRCFIYKEAKYKGMGIVITRGGGGYLGLAAVKLCGP